MGRTPTEEATRNPVGRPRQPRPEIQPPTIPEPKPFRQSKDSMNRPQDFREACYDYFKKCEKGRLVESLKGCNVEKKFVRIPPTMSGLALHLDMSEERLQEMSNGKRWKSTYSWCLLKCKAAAEEILLTSSNPRGAEAALRQLYGWRAGGLGDLVSDGDRVAAIIITGEPIQPRRDPSALTGDAIEADLVPPSELPPTPEKGDSVTLPPSVEPVVVHPGQPVSGQKPESAVK